MSMRHEEFEKICEAVEAGEKRYLKHHITDQVGKVSACSPLDRFDVEIEGKHKSWARENVEETD